MNKHNNDWTVVADCNTVPEATILAGALEAAEIPTVILNKALQSALPMTFTWAPVQVAVPPEYAARAREILIANGNGDII